MNTDFSFPSSAIDIDGNNVNIKELSSHHVLILITLKATWCPVCPKLLLLLNLHGLHNDPPPSFYDPFDNSITKVPPKNIPFNRLLLRSDAYFIIICPGPLDEVKKIRRECNFDKYPYPFIVDEDLALATSIGLRMSNNEIWPCIGYIEPFTCGLVPIFFGRGPGFYGDKDLLNFLREHRIQEEKTALRSIRRARELQTGLSKSRKNNITKKEESKELEISKAPIEEEQKEESLTMLNQNQILPLEILGVIFEYLNSLEIVKTVMATCQQWREIGINIISRRLRCEIERISESLVCFSGTNRKNNDNDDNVGDIVESMDLININSHNNNNNNNIKLISVHELNKMVKNLHEIIEISQRLLIYCDYKQKLY